MRKVFVAIMVISMLVAFTSLQGLTAPKGQGPKDKPLVGSVIAYDANDQYLGIFLGTVDQYDSIFVSDPINYPVFINKKSGEVINRKVSFTNNDCTGTPYVATPDTIVRTVGGQYFIPALPSTIVLILSDIPPYNEICSTQEVNEDFYEATEILEEDIPFTLPVALPLRYEIQ